MGTKVINEYKDGVLHIVSPTRYDHAFMYSLETEPYLRQYSWCYEQSKGLPYFMDLSMQLPALLGYKTPRVYMWAYISFLYLGHRHIVWNRKSLFDYRWEPKDVFIECGFTGISTTGPLSKSPVESLTYGISNSARPLQRNIVAGVCKDDTRDYQPTSQGERVGKTDTITKRAD